MHALRCWVFEDDRKPIDPIIETAPWYTGALEGGDSNILDYSNMSWYLKIETIEDKLFEGDFDGTSKAFTALLDANKYDILDLAYSMNAAIIKWIVDSISNGEAYQGDLMNIIRLTSDYNDDSGSNNIVATIFYAIAVTREMIAIRRMPPLSRRRSLASC